MKADTQTLLELRTRLLKDVHELLIQALDRAEDAEEKLERAIGLGHVTTEEGADPLEFGRRLSSRLLSMTQERDYYRDKCAKYKVRVDDLQHEVAWYRRILQAARKHGMREYKERK